MGSIEHRLTDLERCFGPPPDDPAERARLEEKREAFRVRLERASEQAERERGGRQAAAPTSPRRAQGAHEAACRGAALWGLETS